MSGWSPICREYDPLKAGSIDATDEEPHDRAIFRAMVARYKPNKGVVGDPLLTIFVARLNLATTEDKLREVFSQFGDIQRLRLVRDVVTGVSKGYAFIEYKEERAVRRAWRDGDKLVVDQHEVFVDMEQERVLKGWVPRRLGGGLGGKKWSGQLRFGGRDKPFQKPISILNDGGVGPGFDRGGWRNWDRPGTRERFDRDYGSKGEGRRDRERGEDRGRRDRGKDSKERDRGVDRKDRDREHRDRSRHSERR
ncbi:unnamed protein product [Knipowitschia caucasica]|uniref:U11/U12 small nuclear ribonucleoprotein 35 kDa protein n=1 Tax=Knipowitschia caucasica TaxID=637954 RepID=A0AAV2JDQ9_KNICA